MNRFYRAAILAAFAMAAASLPLAGFAQSAVDGTWRTEGAGRVVVFVDGKEADLKVLP